MFYESIPKSIIVYGKSNDNIFKNYQTSFDLDDNNILLKIKGYELYHKYIADNSKFQINIPFNQKHKLDQYFEDYDIFQNVNITSKELCELFIEPINEMKSLIKNAINRYTYNINRQNL